MEMIKFKKWTIRPYAIGKYKCLL